MLLTKQLQHLATNVFAGWSNTALAPVRLTSALVSNFHSSAPAEGAFVKSLPAEQLWKATTSVSNAGRKRGRARAVMPIRNLNKGQQIGVGERRVVWPGLNAPVIHNKERLDMRELGHDPEFRKRLYEERDKFQKKRAMRLHPMERGWSGPKFPGRSIGPPEPIGDEKFDHFDTKVLEMKIVAHMTGTLGRMRRYSAMVVTGNGTGLAGVARASAVDGRTAIKRAKKRAVRQLIYYPLHENRTIFHPSFCQIGSTIVFVRPKPEGHGFIGHRGCRTISELIGVKDIYAKLEGRNNIQKIVKCFLGALQKQRTYQQIADEKGLHVVEIMPHRDNMPVVLASPQDGVVRKLEEISEHEALDLSKMFDEGKMKKPKINKPPFFCALPSWQRKLREIERTRNWNDVMIKHWVNKDVRPHSWHNMMMDPDPKFRSKAEGQAWFDARKIKSRLG